MIFGYATRPAGGMGSRFGPYVTGGLGLRPIAVVADGFAIRVIQICERAHAIVLAAPERVGGILGGPTPILVREASRVILRALPHTQEIVVGTCSRTAGLTGTNRTLHTVRPVRIVSRRPHIRRIQT